MNVLVDLGWGLLGLASGFVAAELAARWAIRAKGDYFVLPPGLRMRLKPDPETLPQLERATRFDVNREGERGGEVPAGDNVFRVLVAGGSQAEGFLLDQDTAWPAALQRRLQELHALAALGASRIHVGSIARSGVGSEALDLIFARVLPRYRARADGRCVPLSSRNGVWMDARHAGRRRADATPAAAVDPSRPAPRPRRPMGRPGPSAAIRRDGDPHRGAGSRADVLDRHAAALLNARGVEQLDLMPVLERSLETYYDGFHLTPAGARAVADVVAAAVLLPSVQFEVSSFEFMKCVDSQVSSRPMALHPRI